MRSVEGLSKLIIDLHCAALEISMEGFQAKALALLSEHMDFDGTWWGIGAVVNNVLKIHSSYPHNMPENIGDIWENIKEEDALANLVMKNPGITVCCGSDVFSMAPTRKEFLDKDGVRHVLCTVNVDKELNLFYFISIVRRDSLAPFCEEERAFTQLVMPHFFACWTNNRITQISQMAMSNWDPGFIVAIADRKGILHNTVPGLAAMIAEEWPAWRGPCLPQALIAANDHQTSCFTGKRLVINLSRVRDWVMLIIKRRTPADDLSRQERLIADAFAWGESYKEIARRLNISPATVRHHLRRIYEKLDISDKAQLAQIMRR